VVVVAGEPHALGTTSVVIVAPFMVTVGPPTVAVEAHMGAVEAVGVVDPRPRCASISQQELATVPRASISTRR